MNGCWSSSWGFALKISGQTSILDVVIIVWTRSTSELSSCDVLCVHAAMIDSTTISVVATFWILWQRMCGVTSRLCVDSIIAFRVKCKAHGTVGSFICHSVRSDLP